MSRKFTLFAKITTHKFSATQCDWITYFGYDKIKDRGISKSEKKNGYQIYMKTGNEYVFVLALAY